MMLRSMGSFRPVSFRELRTGSQIVGTPAVIVTPSQDDDILTVKTACAELGIAVPTFHNHIQRKRGTPEAVPVIKLRGRYVLYRRQFEAWRRKHYHPKFAPKTSSAASKRTTTKDDDHQTP